MERAQAISMLDDAVKVRLVDFICCHDTHRVYCATHDHRALRSPL